MVTSRFAFFVSLHANTVPAKTLGCSTRSLQAGMAASCEAKLSSGHSFIKKYRRGSFPQPLEVATDLVLPYGLQAGKVLVQRGLSCVTQPFKPLRHADLINRTFRFLDKRTPPGRLRFPRAVSVFQFAFLPFYCAWLTATAQATVAPTMGLLPMPMRPIISTCAGTEEDPANCASECMRPMVSVMP